MVVRESYARCMPLLPFGLDGSRNEGEEEWRCCGR